MVCVVEFGVAVCTVEKNQGYPFKKALLFTIVAATEIFNELSIFKLPSG